MELQLKPPANTCCVTGTAFAEGDRVVSFLARDAATNEFVRLDCLASAEEGAAINGEVLCRWTRSFKPAAVEVNPERALRLTAESLFLSLTEDASAPAEENGPLKQFLALMLERKRVLRPRGRTEDGARLIFEHARTNRMIEVPAGEMDTTFFLSMREKLGGLIGGGASSSSNTNPSPASDEATPATETPSDPLVESADSTRHT